MRLGRRFRATLLPLSLVAWALLAGWVGPAAAAEGDDELYRVAGVPVDATAASAVAARQEALLAGQREGLRRLLRRLTRSEDVGRLPKVEALPVERYVESYQIEGEKVAPTRYVAALSVAYAPESVQGLLRGAGVPFLERRAEPLLVMPALAATAGGEVDLWGEANPWRAAWNERGAAAASPLVELRLPLADAGDVSTLGPGALSPGNPDPSALAAIGQRYEAQAVVVARARLLPGTAGGEGAAPAPAGIELEARRSDRPDADPFLRETLRAQPGEAEKDLLARAADRVVAAVEADLKRTRIIREDEVGSLQAGVPLADLSAWVQIRQGLGAAPEVRSVRVDRFGRGGATVTIAYVGGLEGLVGALGRRGLALAQENDGWQLRQAADPGAFPPPSPASPPTR